MIADMETFAAWAIANAEATYAENLADEIAALEQQQAGANELGYTAPATAMAEMFFAMSPAGIALARAELAADGEIDPLMSPTSRIGGLPVRCDTALEVDWQLRSEIAD